MAGELGNNPAILNREFDSELRPRIVNLSATVSSPIL